MFSYEMMKTTWKEEPAKRPSFNDIVQFFHAQKIEDPSVDEIHGAIVDNKNDSGYVDIFQT